MDPLGPVPQRLAVDAAQVRQLIATQFPRWVGLAVRPVAAEGWDNRTFHLGDDMSVRLPTAAEYALAVDKEHRWLPVLAPHLPLAVPMPLAKGRPGEGYPHPWSVYRWLDGEPATRDGIDDLIGFATTLAAFLDALRRVDPAGGPPPGRHNWFRGGPLRTYDRLAREAMDALGDRISRDAVEDVWQSALRATGDERPAWFHGDVAPGNLLLRDGVLGAVIDFGTCGVGDPSCDLAVAWTMLSGASREVFRVALRPDAAMWSRGRGWALWKALSTWAGGGAGAVDAARVVGDIVDEYAREA